MKPITFRETLSETLFEAIEEIEETKASGERLKRLSRLLRRLQRIRSFIMAKEDQEEDAIEELRKSETGATYGET